MTAERQRWQAGHIRRLCLAKELLEIWLQKGIYFYIFSSDLLLFDIIRDESDDVSKQTRNYATYVAVLI